MKTGSPLAVAGSVICFAVPAFAQQKNTADSKIVRQRDLLGVGKAVDEFGELGLKLDKAYNRNDAAAVSELFTEVSLTLALHLGRRE